jgi:hypothetical protein
VLWFNSETENVDESSKLMAFAATAHVHTKKFIQRKEKKSFYLKMKKV